MNFLKMNLLTSKFNYFDIINRFKNVQEKKSQFQLSRKQIICPKLFLGKKDRPKMDIFERKNKIISERLGLENILKNSLQLDYVKELLMNEKQLYLFNNLPIRTLQYYESKESLYKYNKQKFFENFNNVKVESQESSRKLIKFFDDL
jgi:hypothetical protein